jgi:hypothetical protein
MSRTSMLLSAGLAAAAAAILASAPPAVMPTRRPEFEPGFDMNRLLSDPGRREERKQRKSARRAKLQELQRDAVEGRR